MSQFKLEYHEKNNIGEEGVLLPSLSLDICCLRDIRMTDDHIPVELRLGNIFYNVHANLCYMVILKQHHEVPSHFEHFSFSLIRPKKGQINPSNVVEITDSSIHCGAFSFSTVDNTENFLDSQDINPNCTDNVYLGNIFLDDASVIAENIGSSRTYNSYEDEEFLKKSAAICHLSQLLFGTKTDDFPAFKEAVKGLYLKTLNLSVICAEDDDDDDYFLYQLRRLCHGKTHIKEKLLAKSFHLLVKKEISTVDDDKQEAICWVQGCMDTVFQWSDEYDKRLDILMLSFDAYGSTTLYSFNEDKYYQLPIFADRDVFTLFKSTHSTKRRFKYPYSLLKQDAYEIPPDISNPDFIYYYSERLNASIR